MFYPFCLYFFPYEEYFFSVSEKQEFERPLKDDSIDNTSTRKRNFTDMYTNNVQYPIAVALSTPKLPIYSQATASSNIALDKTIDQEAQGGRASSIPVELQQKLQPQKKKPRLIRRSGYVPPDKALLPVWDGVHSPT